MVSSASGRATLALSTLLLCSPAASSPYQVGEQEPAREPTLQLAAVGADWQRASAFPGWVAVVSQGAELEREADFERLQRNPEGAVELRLEDAIKLALRYNLDIVVQGYSPRLAEEAVRQRQAIYDPLFAFTFAYLQSSSPSTGVLAGAQVLTQKRYDWNFDFGALVGPGTRYSIGFDNSRSSNNSEFTTVNPAFTSTLSFGVSQPLLREFGFDVTESNIQIALTQEQQADEGFRDQLLDTVATVEDSYWLMAQRLKELEVQLEGLELAQELLEINRTRVEVGTMAPLEVSQAEAQVAEAEEAVILAEQALEDAQDRLRTLLNVPLESALWNTPIMPATPPEIVDVDVDVQQAIDRAFELRPDVRQAELELDADEWRLVQTRDGLKPRLDVNAGVGLAGVGGTTLLRDDSGAVIDSVEGGYLDALDQVFAGDFRNWQVGVDFEVPLFNNDAESRYQQTVLSRQRNRDRLEQLKLAVSEEVRRRARQLTSGRKRIDAALATRSFREKALEAERKKFDHGLSTNFEVLRVQQDLTDARSAVVRAGADYLRAIAALYRATGELLERRDVNVGQLGGER